jgi:hypothetical protein
MDTKVEILYPALMPPPTEEAWEAMQPLLEKAKAEGNPWAFAAGSLRNDPTYEDWLAAMRDYRRQVEEAPNY